MRRLLVAFLLLFFFAGTAPAKEKLVIISPHWEGVRAEVTRAFQAKYLRDHGSGIDLEWIDQGGTSDDLRFVESIFKKNPDGIDIDLFFGGGMDPYLRLKDKGLLQEYRVPENTLKSIPRDCASVPNYDSGFHWYGIVLSSFGILYNKKVLSYLGLPAPQAWEDLGKDSYFSWVGAADLRHSGSMHMMYEIILQAYGWEKGWEVLFSMTGNINHFPASASQAAKDTSIGEVAVSMCIDSYALAQLERNGEENMGFVLPAGATVINPDAIGILRGAPNLHNAQRFIDFLLSYEGQLIWMAGKGAPGGPVEFSLERLSIRPDIYNDPAVPLKSMNPYEYKPGLSYDFALASRRWALLNDLIGSCIIDCHAEQKAAWKKVLKTQDERLKREFFRLPVDESMQDELCGSWSDPVFRNDRISRWIDFSRRKFKAIR